MGPGLGQFLEPFASRTRRQGPSNETAKPEALYHSRCGTIKFSPCSEPIIAT